METKKIAELKEGENTTVEADVLEVYDVEEIVKKDGTRIPMQEVLIDDHSAGIILKLWGDKANTLKQNDRVRVVGYVRAFKVKLELTIGKYGKIEVIK